MTFGQYHHSAISAIFCTSTATSSVISLLTCGLYFYHGKLANNYPGRLVFLIAACDFFVWFDRFINIVAKISLGHSLEEENHIYCLVSSFLCCFLGIFNICATFLIVFSIFLEIVFFLNPNKYEKRAYLISVSISCTLALVPFLSSSYDVLDDYQCWIVDNTVNLLVFYTPIMIVLLSDFFFIGYILYFLNKLKSYMEIRSFCKKLLMFPAILLISWTPGLLRTVSGIDSIILAGFMYGFMPLQGVFNPFIYGSMFDILKRKQSKCILSEENERKKPEVSRESETVNTQDDCTEDQQARIN